MRAERSPGFESSRAHDARNGKARTSRPARAFLRDPAASYSPTRRPCSTIGAGGLNGRVRDGNGCFPSAIAAGNRIGDETSWTDQESERAVAHARQRIMVKPHGHLVPVSSTPYGASTPGL